VVAFTYTVLSAGHYLNLPVVEGEGRLVGIVDVLKLTYATLEQVSPSMRHLRIQLIPPSLRSNP
jgi:CBS domain-containing protein